MCTVTQNALPALHKTVVQHISERYCTVQYSCTVLLYSTVQYSRVQYLAIWDCATGKRTTFMKYFTKETNGNFTEDCLGEAEGSAGTQCFSQTVRGKISMGLQVKYFMNFVLFPVAIVTYDVYGILVT